MRPVRLNTDEIEIRPATLADRSAIDDLTENNHHTHFNLDWWTFGDWLEPNRPSAAIWIAQHAHEPIGVVAIPLDASPFAWIRSAAIADRYEPRSIFAALIDYTARRDCSWDHGGADAVSPDRAQDREEIGRRGCGTPA